ncbi:MAG TPA: alcaligin biosynthesis protein [Pseudomonas xinjiangensis]|uniref:Alcaligin biosynthesis protein n=2 Tax=root TaxID=1 RepID=A0A7V1FSB0_9GAMM|nr:alcaligin biosynthesis protein [Halopseudomonas xinjiangensis]HEC46301.1 alcaligin biosynthesis protein [Halopseudomonas xinjiangensis]
MADDHPYDFIAVGVGPFNLGLACLTTPLGGVRSLFLDQKTEFSWHPGMMLNGTTLQNPFLADLVSMADPTSRFSYLNYCKQQGRLYTYYIRENWYLSRSEFDRYCKWVAAQLDNVRFHHHVQEIWHDPALPGYVVSGVYGPENRTFQFRSKRLVLGIGSVPHIPECCCPADASRAIHTANYLANKDALQQCGNITVIGSGQSGAEVYQDLLQDSERHGYTLNWVTRAQRFFQMESARLTLELITPDYGNYFYELPTEVKARTLDDQRSIYNGINHSLIENIYDTLDERRHRAALPARLLTNLALSQCERVPESGKWALQFEHAQLGQTYRHVTDGLVFATGYRYQLPSFIEGIRHCIRWDTTGRYAPSKNWAVDHENRDIFVQNVGLQSHGITNPDLGLACYRNSRLIFELTGRDFYPCEARTVFQDFAPGADSGFVQVEHKGSPQ